jgi:hypothetical protein
MQIKGVGEHLAAHAWRVRVRIAEEERMLGGIESGFTAVVAKGGASPVGIRLPHGQKYQPTIRLSCQTNDRGLDIDRSGTEMTGVLRP